jgi:hypothetical protein
MANRPTDLPNLIEGFFSFSKARLTSSPSVGEPVNQVIDAIVGLGECGRLPLATETKNMGVKESSGTLLI